FRSAAHRYGARVVSVVLSGSLDDGTAGTYSVKTHGGITIVQDPNEALYADMPRNALENVAVDYVLPVAEIAALLERLSREPESEKAMNQAADETQARETEIIRTDILAQRRGERSGLPTVMTCPECGGVVWELEQGELIHYRCHVGHTYTAASMLAAQTDALEAALWTAVRALEESATLARRLATRSRQRRHTLAEQRFDSQADQAETRADVIRKVLPTNRSDGDAPEQVREEEQLASEA
ncbi:MAG: chemotaxis protein CheB, partial [Chloroflexi bacterium]|nr:chemotaxis protein CheB [Chloroflexota bacterium]